MSSFLFLLFNKCNPQIVKAHYVEEEQQDSVGSVLLLDGYKKELGLQYFAFNGICVDAKTGLERRISNYSSTDFISIENFTKIHYDLPFSASSGIAFYDQDKRIIASLAQYSAEGRTYDTIVPQYVRYVRFSRRNDGERSTTITMYGATIVNEKDFFAFQEVTNERMINPRYRVFSNHEFKYSNNGEECYYNVSMPNHQVLNDGTIVVITELLGDRRYLAMKRSKDGGITWDNAVFFESVKLENGIIKDNDSGGNPVLLYDRKKSVLFLFYQPCSYRVSYDGGLHWGVKRSVAHLFHDEYSDYRCYASPCNGIQLANGVLALAYRIEDINKDYDRVCVLFSRNGGASWEITIPTPIKDEKGNIIYADETALVEYKKNCIMLNSRGYSEISRGKRINRRVFVQTNRGALNRKKWTVKGWKLEPVSDLKILDPVCQGSLIKANLNGKRFGVFLNIYSDNAKRTNMLLRVSSDFKHWSQCMFLTLPGEMVHGYSSMCCINDNFSVVSEDAKGIYYMPFKYEFLDKLLRIYMENFLTYK